MKQSLLILALLPLLIGCTDELPTVDGRDGIIMPLAVGNQWVGKLTTYNTTGDPVALRLDTIQIVSFDVAGNPTPDGTKLFTDQDGYQFWYTGEGLWANNTTCFGMGLSAKYPALAPDTFATVRTQALLGTGTAPTDVTSAWQVVSIDTAVTVPAGTFHCYYYRRVAFEPQGGRLQTVASAFYAPQIGPVLMEQTQGEPMQTPGAPVSRWELTGYRLK